MYCENCGSEHNRLSELYVNVVWDRDTELVDMGWNICWVCYKKIRDSYDIFRTLVMLNEGEEL